MKLAYIRVSTVEQNEARQLEAMRSYGIEKYFTEKNPDLQTVFSNSIITP